ncbi:MAG: AAA family ATPase [Armatimonadetes bacterium]|nr:AAA family ATPase [Armatimonadota bacterium]
MIKKIKKISNVGCFYNFNSPNDNTLELKNTNIFYALNGYGKTTITAIFRSLKKNNPDFIVGRNTLNSSDKSEVIFEFGNNENFIFNDSKWRKNGDYLSCKYENLIIFDDDFVNNNIFAEKFEIGHKKSLYKIIFGMDGIILSNKFNELRKNKKEEEKELETIKDKFDLKSYNIDDYIKIETSQLELKKIENMLKKLKKGKLNYKNQTEIKIKESLKILGFLSYDKKGLQEIYKKSINSESHKKAKKEVEKYKEKYFKNKDEAETFIKVGVKNYKEECPFCHKELNDRKDLLEIYKNYFDDSYDDFIKSINKEYESLYSWNIEVDIEKLKNTLKTNETIYEYWSNYIEDFYEIYKTDITKFDFEVIKQKIIEELEQKKQNLNIVIKDENLLLFEKNLKKIYNIVIKYNDSIKKINKQIQDFKDSLKTINVVELEKKENKLIDLKNLFDEEIIGNCLKYKTKISNISKIDKKIETKKKELEEYSKKIIKEYKELINKKLYDIGIDSFELSTIEPSADARAKDAYVEIVIKMLDKNIHLKSYREDEPSFKNSLSRGDKNSLAFAFFLAFLEKKNKKNELIIIFDDPLSSHDENRQDSTAFELRKISAQVKQVIILTHKKGFIECLFRKFKEINTVFFEIDKNINGSGINKLDIKYFLKKDFEKIIDKFNNYLDFGSNELSPGNLLNDIRKLFEDVLYIKYYNRLKTESRPLMQFDTLNDNFFNKDLLLNIKSELIDLANISNDGSHWSVEKLNKEQIKTKIKDAFKVIESI